MPALPVATAFTDAAVTEAQFKTSLTDMREYLATLLGSAGTQAAALTALGSVLNGLLTKTATYTVAAADRGKLITCSGTWTLALTGAGTLGAGFVCAVTNIGTGTITIDPSESQTIDGGLTLALAPGESCVLFCTGTVWYTVGLGRTKPLAGLAFADEYNNSTPGAWTATAPAAATAAAVTVIGGSGGNGYNGGYYGDVDPLSGTGGAGGYSYEVYAVTGGTVLSGTIGAGGQHDSVGSFVNAPSGSASTCTQTGQISNGGQGGKNHAYGGIGGTGGSASGGTINTSGAAGITQGAPALTYGSVGFAPSGSIHIQWRT